MLEISNPLQNAPHFQDPALFYRSASSVGHGHGPPPRYKICMLHDYFFGPPNFPHKPTFQTNLSMFGWPCLSRKNGQTPPTRWNKSRMWTIAWYPVGSSLSHLSMILSVRSSLKHGNYIGLAFGGATSFMKTCVYHKYIHISSFITCRYIYIYIQSYLPTINGQYQKQLSKDNVIKHTCVVLYIYHAMTCLVTVSGCCFQTKLYIRRVKYKIIQLNLLSFKYYNSN